MGNISLVAFRTVLGVYVEEAGSISWRSRTWRLVDSAARRPGGLTGRQLTGPVAEAPEEVNLRSSAASHIARRGQRVGHNHGHRIDIELT